MKMTLNKTYMIILTNLLGSVLSIIPIVQRVARTPESRFDLLPSLGYPWQPSYFEVDIVGYPYLRMHYLDLGPKDSPETLLLLHGVPSWSFLYRKMIPGFLQAGYRIIAVDNIGFGKSDKLTNPREYTHQLHADSVLQLVTSLDLQNVTLFGQDLGGPTGLSVARRETDRFSRLVLLNTLIPQGDIFSSIDSLIRYTPYLVWRMTTLIFGFHHPVGLVFSLLTEASFMEVKGYKAPYPSSYYKAGAYQWPLTVPLKPHEPTAVEMQKVKEFLEKEWTGPVLFGYSDKEIITRAGHQLLRELFQDKGCEVEVPGAGHFLQEDQGEEVARIVISFLENGCN